MSESELEAVIQKATIVAEATNMTREWSHEPPNIINPVTLAERVQKAAAKVGLKCTVLDDTQLDAMGAGVIVAVGKGLNTPSRLIILEYAGKAGAIIGGMFLKQFVADAMP